MTFKSGHQDAFVWFWMPGASEPLICGKVVADDGVDNIHRFIYGKTYRELENAIPLLPHTLSVDAETNPTRRGLHGVLRDAAPDAWGRRVLIYKLHMSAVQGEAELTEIDYLLGSGPGIGALHFQEVSDKYIEKEKRIASLEDMMQAAEAVENNVALPPELEEALLHGTSIGGARPKALIKKDNDQLSIAKFSSSTDIYPMVRLEAVGLELARRAGIDAVEAKHQVVMNKDVLIIDRFDCGQGDYPKRHFFSALTALDLDEMEGRYASYPELADYLRRFADDPVEQCKKLYTRMLFNIFIGNTDDHARNHALFWDGKHVQLTPAYDICIMPRTALLGSQAMDIGDQGKQSSLSNALSNCGRFGIERENAITIADEIENKIRKHWSDVCDQFNLPENSRNNLWERTVLSPAIRELQ